MNTPLSERVAALRKRAADVRRSLAYLVEQERESRVQAPRLLGKAGPARQERIRQELADLASERERCQTRLIELEAELATLITTTAEGGD
jgi:hypothetical protein